MDLRENKEMNNLSLIHAFDEVSAMNCQILDDKKKLLANKLLLLNFLRKGFGIDRQALMVIQRSCPKSLKLIEDCKKKHSVQKKNYKFILQEGMLFAQFTEKFLNK